MTNFEISTPPLPSRHVPGRRVVGSAGMESHSPAPTSGTRPPTVHAMALAALSAPGIPAAATAALDLVQSYCSAPLPHIPGCDTRSLLAIRIYLGKTIEASAAREYAYRWHLFLDAWINHCETRSRSRFAHGPVIYRAPHIIGQ